MTIDNRTGASLVNPRRVFRVWVLLWGLLQTGGFIAFAAADAQGSYQGLLYTGLFLAALPPIAAVGMYFEIRAAWTTGKQPDDFWGGLVPAAIVFVLGWGLWTGTHYLNKPPPATINGPVDPGNR